MKKDTQSKKKNKKNNKQEKEIETEQEDEELSVLKLEFILVSLFLNRLINYATLTFFITIISVADCWFQRRFLTRAKDE